eukprot:6206181-Pleurochrysis_carterae.AAC.1
MCPSENFTRFLVAYRTLFSTTNVMGIQSAMELYCSLTAAPLQQKHNLSPSRDAAILPAEQTAVPHESPGS